MSNVRFLYTFKFDTATITSSSDVGNLVDDNVVDDFVAKKWRTIGDAAESITFDLGTAKRITQVSIFGHNLTGGNITLKANTENSWPGTEYIKPLTWNEFCITEFLDETYQWWKIIFSNPDNPDGYIEIGRICAGEYIEPTVNIDQEVQKKLIDPSVVLESAGRQGYTIEKDLYRTLDVRFTGIGRTQQDQLTTLFLSVKTINLLVFSLDPDDYPGTDTIYCRITTPLSYALGALANGDVSLSFEEKVT